MNGSNTQTLVFFLYYYGREEAHDGEPMDFRCMCCAGKTHLGKSELQLYLQVVNKRFFFLMSRDHYPHGKHALQVYCYQASQHPYHRWHKND